jgi:signal transduction histidine kinase
VNEPKTTSRDTTRPPRGRSLLWTIAGMLLLTAAIGTLIQALVVSAVLRPLENREARARAEVAAGSIASAMSDNPLAPGAALDTLLARQRAISGLRPSFVVWRARGATPVTSPNELVRFVLSRDSMAADTLHHTVAVPPPAPFRSRLEVLARRPVVRGTDTLGTVEIARRVRPTGEFPPPWSSLLFIPIAIGAALVGGLVMVRLLVRRLRSMELLATRVAEGDLTARIADRSGDEIGRLAEQLDRMTDGLASARAQIEATDLQRRQLFADITHELATPLTSIRGAAETLLDPHVPMSGEERTRYMRGMLEESDRLDRLTRDLFELARLEAGSVPLTRERLDWTALCRNTIDRFLPRFEKAGLRLSWRPTVDHAWIDADGHRIVQVLENLLVNALRYVPSGGCVSLELARASSASSDHRYRLIVSDDGPGVPAEDLPHVFERFYRGAERGGSRDVGSGLGLAIVREIVARHGGTVRASARAPHGLTIEIELPGRS